MTIDPYILAFSAITVAVTIWMGFRSAKQSKTASDFFVAGRSVGVGMNASAISGEYLSAASFMGVAGMVMSSGYDALWYPVCYACGYLFLLLFIAGPLRRFGAYTIPDFAEGRFDSPVFRKIAVVFVLFIGFFYTMPQMKGAGTTLAYIFQDVDLRGGWLEFLAPHSATGEAIKGFPYWAGVLIVGAVITLNVALGGMKGITLVQAFQYWAKMFAISVPIFVLMAVYGHYGRQVGLNAKFQRSSSLTTARVYQAGQTPKDYRPAPDIFIAIEIAGLRRADGMSGVEKVSRSLDDKWREIRDGVKIDRSWPFHFEPATANALLTQYFWVKGLVGESVPTHLVYSSDLLFQQIVPELHGQITNAAAARFLERQFEKNGVQLQTESGNVIIASSSNGVVFAESAARIFHEMSGRQPLPAKAPRDETWLNPFGPLTTKAAKAAAAAIGKQAEKISREGGEGSEVREGQIATPPSPPSLPSQTSRELPAPAGAAAEKAWLAKHERPYALLYTYSLIIALVCGTAGLPHILVRFYTNPDGVAAKRTTMWVMILIGVFYVFPPVFGVMGRNLLPELYSGVGAKGTDKIVLELPRILNERFGVLGSILSGITCAGAFAAFMSTFSGLLVSMTGALAHDVYGRMLNPKASADQRMRMFKWCAVIVGGVAILLGSRVEKLEINFMVGQAFAIAAASYFPLLFMSVWWRRLTMKGAATGMLTGGLLALGGISLTSFTTLGVLKWDAFWAAHPLLRILCEQPAIWAVPLAITLMVVVSLLTRLDVPADIRMKMLVLHAPEKLGLKQEYIQEHQPGH